jgi:hypothetical protein
MLLFVLGLLVSLGVTFFQRVPGYTDAEYYYGGGLRLFEGQGFSEMILWNYLDDPAGLPHPSHAYWMPLPSILAMFGMVVFRNRGYFAARSFFLLLASLVPPLTALIAKKLGQSRKPAFLAGLLGLFSGFYMIYATLTEGFAPVMVLGGIFLLAAFGTEDNNQKVGSTLIFLLPGVAAGLMHLTRADGFLWLAAGLAAAFWVSFMWRKQSVRKTLVALGCVLAGYLLIMGPWFWRNWQTFGSILTPGGSRAFWLQNYNQIFVYPADQLTFDHWLASGWKAILVDRLTALWSNLKTAFAVQGEIFLLPLMVAGAWKMRRDQRIFLGGSLWLAVFMVMSVVFPYAGARGGFFHSGAAVQPLLWACVPAGLQVFVDWGVKKRNWDGKSAMTIFGGGIVALSLLLSGLLFMQRVVGSDPQKLAWENSWNTALTLAAALDGQGAHNSDVVMINNPAGWYAATGRAAIVTPDGEVDAALQAAHRYNAKYLILEADHVEGLKTLYEHPGDGPGLKYLGVAGDACLFRFSEEK